MVGEETGKMPELYVEALFDEHGLSKRPQAAMRSKSKRVRNLHPTSPQSALMIWIVLETWCKRRNWSDNELLNGNIAGF